MLKNTLKKPLFILLLILILAICLRVYRLTSLPMYGDELTMVYDTYSILKTGKDATGQAFPITFKMGAGRPGGYIYFSLPFVALLGPTEWGVRSLSIISSVGIIIILFFLGNKLFGGKSRVGLFASALAALSPWDIYLSRGGFEAHFALFLALLGITTFVYKKYFVWALTWGVAIHTYPTFKLTLPLMGIILLWFSDYKTVIKNKIFVLSLMVIAVCAFFTVRETLMGVSEARFMSLNLFSDQNIKQIIIQDVNMERYSSDLPKIIKPVFINKQIEYGRLLLKNYISNLSPQFLFVTGDGIPRHNPGEMGMLYLAEIPLIFLALVNLFTKDKRKFILLVLWILITPLATMFFPETHALRNGLMLPALIILSAYGFYLLPKNVKPLIIFCLVIQLIYILIRIYYVAPYKFADHWSVAAKNASLTAINVAKTGGTIALSTKIDNIEYAYEVYAKVDPKIVQAQYGKFPKFFGQVQITDK